MHKSVKNVSGLFLLVFTILSIGVMLMSASFSLAKSDKASKKSTKSEKVTKEEKVNVKKESKNFEKAQRKSLKEPKESEKPGKSNAKLYKEKIEEVSENLSEVADEEKQKEKEQVAQEIEEISQESEETSQEVTEAIVEVESKNKFKRFLIGTDYKNLGQLRSSLVKNENQIRKLTKIMEKMDAEDRTVIEEQLLTLTQERERIKTVIMENEEGFSLLGWASRLINGYPKDSIDEEAEEGLMDDVQEALESEEEEGEGKDKEMEVDETGSVTQE